MARTERRPSGQRAAPSAPAALSIQAAFHAGHYADVLARTVDAPDLDFDDAEIEFIVRSLAFVGRIEEARACLAAWPSSKRGPGGARARAASPFFLASALCRAGRYD